MCGMNNQVVGRICTIRAKWENQGQTGEVLAEPISVHGTSWTPVLWFGYDDPEFHKTDGLIFGSIEY
jgi:hypothetical protein